MAGDLAIGGAGGGFVAEGEPADGEAVEAHAGEAGGEIGIVVAGDPDPVAAGLERGERGAVVRADRRWAPSSSWKLSPSATTTFGWRYATSAARRASVSPVS